MITVRALHDGIFAVSTISDDGEDDCPPPRSPSCRSCLLWIVGQAYVCADCERTYCNAGCASSERHRCAGRQTAIDKLPCKEPHEKRMVAARAYEERQKALARDPAVLTRALRTARRSAVQLGSTANVAILDELLTDELCAQ